MKLGHIWDEESHVRSTRYQLSATGLGESEACVDVWEARVQTGLCLRRPLNAVIAP